MSTTTETIRVGVYNGKKFKVLFAGKTKHGERAKLAWFSDDEKSFWVDLDKVEIKENTPPKAQAPKAPKKPAPQAKATKHCASCTCGKPLHEIVSEHGPDEGSEEQPDEEPTVDDMIEAEEASLFGHAAPVSKPVGHKVGKGSTTCACGAKKKPQYDVCYGCFQSH